MSKRLIYIGGEITEELAIMTHKSLLLMDGEGDITIRLSTWGGLSHEAFAIYDAIKDCNSVVTIVASGKIASAGNLILQAGDRRYALPNTRFMLHDGGLTLVTEAQPFETVRSTVRELKDVIDAYIEGVCEKSKINPSTFRKSYKFDTYFGVAKALELGLIDKVLPPKRLTS